MGALRGQSWKYAAAPTRGAAIVVVVAALWALGWQPALAATVSLPGAAFDPAAVEKGAQLAAIGNCKSCHTAPNGKPYAGGRALSTPFGTIYGSNITPDPESGIGNWSQAEFMRAMREGVDRRGRHIYPAFPYDHYTRVNAEDVDAIYAFLMTREPVRAAPPPNELAFPFNIRSLVGIWKLLYFHVGPLQPNAAENEQWNRGAYLVEGLAHCGACHTPRNFLGAEIESRAFNGGQAEGWQTPALDASSAASSPWTVERLYAYLRQGIDDVHDVTAGPMAPIVHDLSRVSADDVRAIATYVASFGAGQTPRPTSQNAATELPASGRGAAIYAGACASCHDLGREVHGGALKLSLSTAVAMPQPDNLIRIVRQGIVPAAGESGPWMPAFAGVLTDAQLTDLAIYLRTRFGERAAWDDLAGAIEKIAPNPSTP